MLLSAQTLNAKIILEEAASHSLNRTWIAGDTWSTDTTISSIDGIQNVRRTFGFIWKTKEVPGFEEYIRNRQEGAKKHSSNWGHYLACPDTPTWSNGWNCSFVPTGKFQNDRDTRLDLGCFVRHIKMFTAKHDAIYLAVNTIAHGLKRLLKCNSVQCKQSTDFPSMGASRREFDVYGYPKISYNSQQRNLTNRKFPFDSTSEYDLDGNIHLLDSLIYMFGNITARPPAPRPPCTFIMDVVLMGPVPLFLCFPPGLQAILGKETNNRRAILEHIRKHFKTKGIVTVTSCQ
ncbi:G-protein coupled receptor family C group 6 member A-like [Arapaima gigas]